MNRTDWIESETKIGLNRSHSLEIDTKKWIRIGPIGLNRAEWIESNLSGLKSPMLGGNIFRLKLLKFVNLKLRSKLLKSEHKSNYKFLTLNCPEGLRYVTEMLKC